MHYADIGNPKYKREDIVGDRKSNETIPQPMPAVGKEEKEK